MNTLMNNTKSSMKRHNLASNLKEILDFHDWNQAEFADKLEITQAAVSQILSGEREPSLPTTIRILEVTGVTFERLLK